MTLGQRITRARAAHRLSQNDLAEALEVSRQSVSKWETDASVPELDKLIKLCQLFDMSMDALVLGVEPEKAETAADSSEAVRGGWNLQRVIGLMLIFFGLLFFTVMFLVQGREAGITALYCAPMLLCGTLCLMVRKYAPLACAWGLWGLFALSRVPYFRDAVGFVYMVLILAAAGVLWPFTRQAWKKKREMEKARD